MAVRTASKTVEFASAAPVSAADELLDKVVAFRPIRIVTLETTVGISDATECQVVEIGGDGTPIDLGERPVFWTVVRRQLARASAEVPWIVGTLVKSGQAYRLDSVTEIDAPRVRAALSALAD